MCDFQKTTLVVSHKKEQTADPNLKIDHPSRWIERFSSICARPSLFWISNKALFFILFFSKTAFISPSGLRPASGFRTAVHRYRITRYLVTAAARISAYVRSDVSPNIPTKTRGARYFMESAVRATARGISFLEIVRLDIDVSQTSFVETWP